MEKKSILKLASRCSEECEMYMCQWNFARGVNIAITLNSHFLPGQSRSQLMHDVQLRVQGCVHRSQRTTQR